MSVDFDMNAMTLLQVMSNLMNVNKSGKRKERTGVGCVWHTLNVELNIIMRGLVQYVPLNICVQATLV